MRSLVPRALSRKFSLFARDYYICNVANKTGLLSAILGVGRAKRPHLSLKGANSSRLDIGTSRATILTPPPLKKKSESEHRNYEPLGKISQAAITFAYLTRKVSTSYESISDSTSLLEKRLETMLVDMQELRDQMESFKHRAETAEAERDSSRKTLAEMVEKIRSDELERKSSSTERGRSVNGRHITTKGLVDGTADGLNSTLAPLLEKAGLANGHAEDPGKRRPAAGTLSRPPGSRDSLLYHTTPYASMIGVALIGMGLMAYLNGWQPPKGDR